MELSANMVRTWGELLQFILGFLNKWKVGNWLRSVPDYLSNGGSGQEAIISKLDESPPC